MIAWHLPFSKQTVSDVLSGRMGSCKKATSFWTKNHVILIKDFLWMVGFSIDGFLVCRYIMTYFYRLPKISKHFLFFIFNNAFKKFHFCCTITGPNWDDIRKSTCLISKECAIHDMVSWVLISRVATERRGERVCFELGKNKFQINLHWKPASNNLMK